MTAKDNDIQLDAMSAEPGVEDASDPEARDATSASPSGEGAAAKPAERTAAEQELEAVRDRHLRLAAEYDNYRKRSERERSESWGRAQAELVKRMLEAIDDLQRVAQLDVEATTAASVVEGVQLVERKLIRALEGAGLERIEAEGQPFDPEVHEALVATATPDREADDTVAEVFQTGYVFKGVLLRPARVRVQKFEG